jgi:hypothetical protein
MRRIVFAICVVMIGVAVCGARQAAVTSPSNRVVASAQTVAASPGLDALAAQVARQIEKKHLKSVLVIGAVGRDAGRLTQDGQEIGDEFSAALTKNANGFQVVDRAGLRDFLEKNGISESMAVSDALSTWIARISKVAGYVVIQFGDFSNGNVNINANLCRVEGEAVTVLDMAKATIGLSDEQKRSGFRLLELSWNKPTLTTAQTEKLPPDRSPKCTSRSTSEFAEVARRRAGRNADETVDMYVTVFPDGKVGEIAISRSTLAGLNEVAVETVLKNWRFTPAVGSDGKPMAFRTMVEISYQSQ